MESSELGCIWLFEDGASFHWNGMGSLYAGDRLLGNKYC